MILGMKSMEKLELSIQINDSGYESDRKPRRLITNPVFWVKKQGHHITIWSTRLNTLEIKLKTEKWLQTEQIPYDRLLFDKPDSPVFVNDTPPNAKYFKSFGDNDIVSTLFEEWVEDIKQC